MTLDGVEIPSGSPKGAIKRGLYLAPEDRRKEGVLTTMTVRENITMPAMERYSSIGLISRPKEVAVSNDMKERLRIKAPTVESAVRGLSGGNQQKVVLAKWLSLDPKVLIFDEPTRGIDIGARSEIYALMRGLAEAGAAILMISSDMEESLGFERSDRRDAGGTPDGRAHAGRGLGGGRDALGGGELMGNRPILDLGSRIILSFSAIREPRAAMGSLR